MYYYVYQITNLTNNKIYVGKHKSAKHPLENGYYGSGKQIQAAIKKYGIDRFKKEVLHFCSSKEEMASKEAEIVTEDFVKQVDTYNMHKGGNGGWDHYNGTDAQRISSSRGAKLRADRPDNLFKDPNWQKNFNSMKNPEIVADLCNRAKSLKSIEKRKKTFSTIKHQQGEKNSQFGRIWISNILTKEVKRITINDTIPEGWVRGKKGHLIKECWVNNGVREHFIDLNKKQEYLDKGFIAGRLKTSVPQK